MGAHYLLCLPWVMLALLICMVVHEFGHFTALKALGVRVETFTVGTGRLLLMIITGRGSALYLRRAPIVAHIMQDQLQFRRLANYKKIIVFTAGPIFDFALAFLVLSFLIHYNSSSIPIDFPFVSLEVLAVNNGLNLLVLIMTISFWAGILNLFPFMKSDGMQIANLKSK
ncbi:MAG: site-2 protease family protein [Ignavibacteriales bacterium]